MRIAIDARYLSADFSGIGIYSKNQLEAISREDQSNEYTVFVHSSFRGQLALGPNFEVVHDPARPVSLRTVSTLQTTVSQYGVDLLHSYYPLVPLLWNKKLAVTVHDLQPLLDPEFTGQRRRLTRSLYDLFYHVTYPAALRKSNCLVSVSYATKEYLTSLFPELSDKILVVHEGVSPESYQQPTEEQIERVREKYDIPDRFIFYIGSTRPNKNLSAMLDAFEQFLERNPEQEDLYWVMVLNSDRFFDPLFARIRERGLLRRIHIHEQVSEAEKRVFYHLATLLYFVTKFEGFGLPVLEAQAMGLPVLASTHGALPEIAGQAAILCDPFDTEAVVEGLELFFHDPDLGDRMITAGKENVKRFTWQKAAKEIVDMYNHVLS